MILFQAWSNWLIGIIFVIISYLIGSIPFGLVLGKTITGIDVREHGSHNIGSTNCIRVLGKKVGFLVFFFEVLKGAFVILLVRYVFNGLIFDNPIPLIIYGAFAAIGHLFPIYINFKGGKIVATSLGVVLALTPIPGIACLIAFGLIFVITGYVSLCSCGAAITVGVVAWLQYAFGLNDKNVFLMYLWGKPELLTCIIYSLLIVIIFVRHIPNFKRLANGTENNFKKKEKEANASNIEEK